MLHCPYCKARHPASCCPFYLKALSIAKVKTTAMQESFQSSSPAPFVGSYGYPDIRVGLLAPQERKDDVWVYDAPKFWALNSFQIQQIVDFRTSLLNSQQVVNIRQKQKITDIAQQVAMSDKPVELEVKLKDLPVARMNFDAFHAPTGPNALLKSAQITANPSIPTKVDKVVSDIDFRAVDAVACLYERGFDENFLTRLLSVGTLGIKMQRRLVPTKWSITAVDDILGKNLLKKIKDCKIADYAAFFGNCLGNYYLILFFPDVWSYELFELSLSGSNRTGVLDYSTDYELFASRKDYASDCAGGYYSVRLAVLEKLEQMKRQASVIVIRVITDEYTLPLGVWVTREASRKALAANSIVFSEKDLMLKYAQILMQKKFGLDITKILMSSAVLKNVSLQKKITHF